jgi:hypothetical protein
MHNDYRVGFQDAINYCLAEIEKAKDKETALKKLQRVLKLVVEERLENVRYEFSLFGDAMKED